MFHPARRNAEPTAYEYNLQPTEDHEDVAAGGLQPAEKPRRPRGKRANYKPTALTWPFILSQIVVLGIALGLIVWAERAMPDSDSTAVIDPVPSSKAFPARVVRAEFGKEFRRDNSSTAATSTQTTPSSSAPSVSTASSHTTTANPSTAAVTSSMSAADTAQTDKKGPTTASETVPTSSTPALSSTPTLSSQGSGTASTSGPTTSSGASTTSPSGAKKVATTDNSLLTTPTSSTATPRSSSGSASSSPGSASSPSGSASRSPSGSTSQSPSGSASSSRSSSDSASASASTRSKADGKLSGQDSPTTTDLSTSLSTTIFTSYFTTTAQSTRNLTSKVTFSPHTTTLNVTKSTVITTSRTLTFTSTRPPTTTAVSFTTTGTSTSTTVYTSTSRNTPLTSTSTVVSLFTSVVVSSSVVEPTTLASVIVDVSTFTVVGTSPTTTEVPATTSETVIETYVPYLSTGQTVITSVATVIIQPPPQTQATEAPVTVIGTSVAGGQVYTVVDTFAPETKVVGVTGGPATQLSTPPPQTIVSQVGGTLTTNYIVITPTPTAQTVTFNTESTIGGETETFVQTQAPQTIVTSQGGSLVTLITTPPPQTQVTVIGGTRTTVPVTSTSSGFQPISYAITTNIGGSTSVVVSTPSPTRIVTTINGTPVTIDTTLPATTYTTTFGGTQVTELTATTPTGTDPITLTFASTVGGTLTTIVQTFAPVTYTTDISGTLTTITSTPSPSTHLSTASLHTTTFTSTSTPIRTGSATTSAPPAITSLVVTTKTFDLTSREYFVGTFLPPLLAMSLIIPLRIIDLNAKLYQPFNSLSHPSGSSGYDAMTLQFTGLMGFVTPAVTLLQGHPVPFVTTLIVLLASLTVPLAVEAVSLKLHGHCNALNSAGCAAALGVNAPTNHALMALVALLILLLALLLFFLRDWVTGLHANPWNIAGTASLIRNPDVRLLGSTDAELRRAVGDRQYGLGYYEHPDTGREEYGLLLADDSSRGALSRSDPADADELYHSGVPGTGRSAVSTSLPFMTLRYPWRVAFVLFLLGLVVLIAYYDYTLVAQEQDPTVPLYMRFHLFFDSYSFGIRFLFASLGVLITFCWQAFFVAVATIVPYQSMAHRLQPPQRSILVSRPTNAFYGIVLAARQRHAFYVAVSAAAILSEFLPILLSNIPHKLTQVLGPTLVCTRLSLGVLAAMVCVVVWSFFVRWPPMPVDPRCVAGAAWYVSRSRMLADFEGVSEMDSRQRERRVKEMGKRYYYGGLVGQDRIGVDCEVGIGEGVETAYLGRRGEDALVYDDRAVTAGGLARRDDGERIGMFAREGREQDPAPNERD